MNERDLELLRILRHLEASGRKLPQDMADKKVELENLQKSID